MYKHEKKELIYQFVEFIQALKKLVFQLKKHPDKYKDLQELVSIVDSNVQKYYLNLDLCSECGHPIPSLPSRTRLSELEGNFAKYLKTYETLTGDVFDLDSLGDDQIEESQESLNSNFQLLNLEQMEKDAEEQKKANQVPLAAAPRLQQLAERDRKPVIKAQLVKVS
jgi:DNA repair exonuclease SbcCD ATPase subunit